MCAKTRYDEPASRVFRDKNFGYLVALMNYGSPRVTMIWAHIDGDYVIIKPRRR